MEARIHAILSRCGVEPIPLLKSLGLTRALISGSVPVEALTNLPFLPNDVDIYVPLTGKEAMEVVIDDMDFTCDKASDSRYPKQLGIETIKWFSKGPYKINLMVVKGPNPLTAIFKFHSTVVMNFISFHGLYCAYPDMTLYKLSIVNTKYLLNVHTFRRMMACLTRYRARGITFETEVR
jgi:hypothetical protein